MIRSVAKRVTVRVSLWLLMGASLAGGPVFAAGGNAGAAGANPSLSSSSPAPWQPVLTIEDSGGGAPVLGIDHETELLIQISGAGPEMEHPVPLLATNVGHLDPPIRRGPGLFTVRFEFPPQRFPQVAIFAARTGASRNAVTAVHFLPLRAVASPAFRTDPDAQVTLSIGDKVFGPQRADETGELRIPVVVPPGITKGVARSVNRFGKGTEEVLDLAVPDYQRVLIAVPEVLVAGTVAEVMVYAVDRAGHPINGDKLKLRVNGQHGHPLESTPLGRRFLVPALPGEDGRHVTLRATIEGDDSQRASAEIGVPVVSGSTGRLQILSDRSALVIGSLHAATVSVRAQDADGRPIAAAGTHIFVDGVRAAIERGPDDTVVATVPAPVRYAGKSHVLVEAILDRTYARHEISLDGLPARRIPRLPPLDPVLTLAARGGILWTWQQSAGPAITFEGYHRPRHWPTSLAWGLDLALLHNRVFGGDESVLARARLLQMPLLLSGRWRVRPHRAVEFHTRIGAGLMVIAGDIINQGERVAGTTFVPAVKLAGEVALNVTGGQVVLGLGYLYAQGVDLTPGDRLQGNPAGLVADAGYRWCW